MQPDQKLCVCRVDFHATDKSKDEFFDAALGARSHAVNSIEGMI